MRDKSFLSMSTIILCSFVSLIFFLKYSKAFFLFRSLFFLRVPAIGFVEIDLPFFNIKVSGSNNRLKLPIYVNIIDNGPGIPERIRSHLFEPFVTSKYGGSGIGLSIVSSIVEEHGGIIEVNSHKKTIFTVLFPALEESKKWKNP